MQGNGNGWHKDTHWTAVFAYRMLVGVTVLATLAHQIMIHLIPPAHC